MFSDRETYMINLLAYLAREDPEEPLTVSELAEATNIPGPYLKKIVSELSGIGYLETRKGPSGGVLLRQPATEILLSKLFDDIGTLKHKEKNGEVCCETNPLGTCFRQHFIDEFRDSVLGATSLRDMTDTLS